MTATYTDDQVAKDGDVSADTRKRVAADLVMAAPPEVTSTPDIPGRWSGSAKLALILGGGLAFWGAVALLVVWIAF